MMSSTFGAPFGGTTCGGHHGFESLASSLITPPNCIGGGGSCLPSRVTVALGDPGSPVICCAGRRLTNANRKPTAAMNVIRGWFIRRDLKRPVNHHRNSPDLSWDICPMDFGRIRRNLTRGVG